MLKEVKSDGGWHTYVFSLILLLAQVLFREEVLTLSVDVSVWALKYGGENNNQEKKLTAVQKKMFLFLIYIFAPTDLGVSLTHSVGPSWCSPGKCTHCCWCCCCLLQVRC